MLGYIVKRILATIPVMGIVAVFVFLLLRLTPGDPAAVIAGDGATLADLEKIRASLGLDKPLHVQFVTWVGQLLQGNLGTSIISNQPVTWLIGQRIWPTMQVGVLTILMSVFIAVPMGVIAAWKHRTFVDHAIMTFSVLAFSVPVFVIGYILVKVFALDLQWLPVQGYVSPTEDLRGFSTRAILPCFALALIYVALIARMTRASMLEVLGEDYIRTAHAKGVQERRVLFRHALRNAAVPILTIIGAGFAYLISGVVITESVFNIPGIGRLTVDAVLARDYPVIQAMILVTSAIYVAVNLLIDISYCFFDPRIRY